MSVEEREIQWHCPFGPVIMESVISEQAYQILVNRADQLRSGTHPNSDINTEIIYFEMDKKELSLKKDHEDFNFKILKDQIVVFIDDVMNTGSTLIYAINQILPFKPKEVQIGVLIERNFNNFPVLPNYKGLQLSTSKNEHVKVEIGKSPKVIII